MGLEVRVSLCDYREKRIHSEQNLSFDKEEIDGKTLLQSVAETLKTSPDEIDLFFAGRLIQSSSDFLLKDKTGFESGSKIQVLYKPIEPKTEDSVSVDQGELKMCMAGLHLMLNNKHQRWKSRKAVLGILKSKESLAEIVNAIPSLKSDTLSLDILKNPDLFASVVDPKNCSNIMELHRPLAAAMIALSHKVSLSTGASSSGSQVEMAMDVDGSPGTSQSTRRSNRPNPNLSTPRGQSIITSSQLATALSMANSPAIFPSPIGTPASLQSPLPVTPSSGSGSAATSSQGGSSAPGMLTPDVFSQAMQQALSQSSSPGASGGESQPAAGGPPAQLPESVIKEGLEQLRSMGIQDEQASRQALVVAGGNVQTAVNILFASGMEDL